MIRKINNDKKCLWWWLDKSYATVACLLSQNCWIYQMLYLDVISWIQNFALWEIWNIRLIKLQRLKDQLRDFNLDYILWCFVTGQFCNIFNWYVVLSIVCSFYLPKINKSSMGLKALTWLNLLYQKSLYPKCHVHAYISPKKTTKLLEMSKLWIFPI